MDQMLQDAIREKIDAKLSRAELRGGATGHEEFMAELRARMVQGRTPSH